MIMCPECVVYYIVYGFTTNRQPCRTISCRTHRAIVPHELMNAHPFYVSVCTQHYDGINPVLLSVCALMYQQAACYRDINRI